MINKRLNTFTYRSIHIQHAHTKCDHDVQLTEHKETQKVYVVHSTKIFHGFKVKIILLETLECEQKSFGDIIGNKKAETSINPLL